MVVVLKGKDFITTRFDQLKSRLIRVDLIVENIAHLTCHLCIICRKLVKYFHILKLQSIIAFCWRQGGPNLTPIQLNQIGPWSLKWVEEFFKDFGHKSRKCVVFHTYILLPLKYNSQTCCKFGDILHYIVYKDRYHVIKVIYPNLPPTMFNVSNVVLFLWLCYYYN